MRTYVYYPNAETILQIQDSIAQPFLAQEVACTTEDLQRVVRLLNEDEQRSAYAGVDELLEMLGRTGRGNRKDGEADNA